MDNFEFEDEEITKEFESNKELFEIVKSYLLSIKDYPLLSIQEEKDLMYQYKVNNNLEAREKLIKHNLRLVVWYIKNSKKITKSYQFIDLIQEGNIGLIKAIDKFDISFNNRLSTYAIPCIRQAINVSLGNNDETIRIPINLKNLVSKYFQYVSEFAKINHREPTADEIKQYLNLTEEKYLKLMNITTKISSVESLNKMVGEEETSTLEDFVADNSNDYNIFENNIDEKILFYKLKTYLNDFEYYLIYYYILNESKVTYEELANTFGITREFVRQEISRALYKIKKNKLLKKQPPALKHLDKMNLKPIDFPKKVILLFLKDKINIKEYYYLYYSWYKGLEKEELIRKLNKYGIDYDELAKSIEKMSQDIINISQQTYQQILEIIKEKYTRSQIFSADISLKDESLLQVEQIIKHMSKEEIISLIERENFDQSQKDLIIEYFENTFQYVSPSLINLVEAKINVQKLNYKGNRHVSLDKLFKTYQKNKNIFEESYQIYLEGTLFSSFTKLRVKFDKLYNQRENNSIIRLEQLYYQIDNFFQYSLPEKEIRRVLKEFNYLFTQFEIDVITLRYLKHLTIKETAQILNEDPKVISSHSGPFFDKVLNISLGCFKTNVIRNEALYIKYINDLQFEMSEMGRKVCKLRFEKHMDYKDIADTLGIKTTQQVSNFIGKVIHLIDYHHYNVLNETIYDKEKIYKLLSTKKDFTPLEKDVIIARFIENKNAEKIREIFSLNPKEYNRIVNKFINHYITYFAAKNITKDDISTEINQHVSDQVLTEIQQKILAFSYGIQCVYNELGEELSKQEIINRLKITENVYNNNLRKGKNFLGARKNGIIGPPLGRLSRAEVIEILKDPNVPLSDDEKELLCQIKGIGGKTYTIDEIAVSNKVNSYSIKRRITNCYVNILKYLDGKKEKQLNFDVDILPILKYFPLFRQNVIRDIYEKKLTVKEMCEKYNISQSYALQMINEIERKLLYYLKYPKSRKFDYDYARSVLFKEDLPYYGNKKLAISYYIRYFGEDGEFPANRSELLDDLNIGDNTKTSFMIRDLMLATLRYKEGIRKINSFTKEEIIDHYQKYQDYMYSNIRRIFEFTIKNAFNECLISKRKINDLVIYELLKYRNENLIKIEDLSTEETIKLIRDNPYHLSFEQLEWVRNFKQIPKQVFMNGKSKRKVLSILSPVILKYEEKNNCLLKKQKV